MLVLELLLADFVIGNICTYFVLSIFKIVHLLQKLLLACLKVLNFVGQVVLEGHHLIDDMIVLVFY